MDPDRIVCRKCCNRHYNFQSVYVQPKLNYCINCVKELNGCEYECLMYERYIYYICNMKSQINSLEEREFI
jgi:hypothetical protein